MDNVAKWEIKAGDKIIVGNRRDWRVNSNYTVHEVTRVTAKSYFTRAADPEATFGPRREERRDREQCRPFNESVLTALRALEMEIDEIEAEARLAIRDRRQQLRALFAGELTTDLPRVVACMIPVTEADRLALAHALIPEVLPPEPLSFDRTRKEIMAHIDAYLGALQDRFADEITALE